MEDWSTFQIYTLLVLFVASACTRIIYWHIVHEVSMSYDGKYYKFDNALFLLFFAFLIQILSACYFASCLMCMRMKNQQRLDSSEKADGFLQRVTCGNMKFNVYIFILPSFILFFAHVFILVDSSMLHRGIAHIIESFTVITVLVLSKLSSRMKYSDNVWRGTILVCIGHLFIGMGHKFNVADEHQIGIQSKVRPIAELKNSTNGTHTEPYSFVLEYGGIFAGVCIIAIGVFAKSAFKVMVEVFTKNNDIPPLIANFWIGLFGTIIAGLMFIPAYFIQDKELYSNPDGHYEDIRSVYAKVINNRNIAFLLLGSVLAWGLFSICFITVSKDEDAITAEVVYFSGCLLQFFLQIAEKRYRDMLHWIECVGYVIIFIGTLVYFNLVFGPCMSRIMKIMQPSSIGLQSEETRSEDTSVSSFDEMPITKIKRKDKDKDVQVLYLRNLTLEY
ncbi:hypothetical protein L9F63_017642 [Diploptera punctata]|uniref:Uncharacterized protein n=1 Tax=Diploptera punctata TaxID=6984 RepID=A0AAD8EG19_DIPPU|nr:hypothetical protein L9F63_017642 [Diploptera punctata]